MTTLDQIVTCDHMDKVMDGIAEMAENNISSILVVKEGEIEGIVTSHDINKILHKEKEQAFELPLGSIMVRDLISIKATEPLNNAIQKMEEAKTHHLLVTNEGRYVGILSSFDVVREKALDARSHPWIRY